MGGLVSGYRPLGSDEIKTNFSEGGSLLRSQAVRKQDRVGGGSLVKSLRGTP